MAMMERMALGAHNPQGPVLTEQPAHKRKLNDVSLDRSGAEILDTPESYDSNKYAESPMVPDDMPMSETKRRAQNRAAQRAFRERKERHLRELEKRLVELESESRSWKSTNLVLRSQLSLLEEQLNHYRNPNQAVTGGPPPPAPLSTPSTLTANPNVPSSKSLNGGNPLGVSDVHNQPPPNSSHYSPNSMLDHNALNSFPDPGMLQPAPYANPHNMSLPSQNTQANLYAGNMAPSPHHNDAISGMGGVNYPSVTPLVMPPQSSPSQLNLENQPYNLPPSLSTGYHDTLAHNPAIDSKSSMRDPEKPPSLLSGDTGSSYHYTDPSSKGSPDTPSRAEMFCEKLSMACGMHRPSPPENAPKIFAEVPGWQSSAEGQDTDITANWVMQNGGWTTNNRNAYANGHPDKGLAPHPSSVTPQLAPSSQLPNAGQATENQPLTPDELFNFDFGNMASGFGEFNFGSQPANGANFDDTKDMDNLLSNDFGVFDPLDNLLNWDQPKDTKPDEIAPSKSNPSAENTDDIKNNAEDSYMTFPPSNSTMEFNTGHLTEPFGTGSQTSPNPLSFSPALVTGDTNSTAEDSGNTAIDEVPAASQKFIPCADVWDRICSHPRFGEIDINSMCQELRNKARCSKMGVVLDEEDVDSVLQALR